MAHYFTDTNTGSAVFAGFKRRATAFGQSVLRGLEAYAHARSRTDRVERLNAKTDAELAAMGLTRDKIVHHVFRDLYYL